MFDWRRRYCATTPNLNQLGRAHRRSDYVVEPRTGSTARSARRHAVRPAIVASSVPGVSTRNGFLLENGDREQEYKGVSLTSTSASSNRWMARGNVSWYDWKWNIAGQRERGSDPQHHRRGGQALRDGDQVIQGSGTGSGSKGNVCINSEWSYSFNGLYQVAPDRPWGFNVAPPHRPRRAIRIIYFERVLGSAAGSQHPGRRLRRQRARHDARTRTGWTTCTWWTSAWRRSSV